MTALEHGMHWPAAEQQLDSAEDPDADDVFMVDVFMEMQATTIQAAFRDRLARRQGAAALFPLPPQSLQPMSSSSRLISGSRSAAFLIFTAITLFATVKMLGTAAAPVPTLPYTALTRAIENDEVRALGLHQDLLDRTVWHALALLHDRGQTRFAVSMPTRSVSSLLDLVRSHGVDLRHPRRRCRRRPAHHRPHCWRLGSHRPPWLPSPLHWPSPSRHPAFSHSVVVVPRKSHHEGARLCSTFSSAFYSRMPSCMSSTLWSSTSSLTPCPRLLHHPQHRRQHCRPRRPHHRRRRHQLHRCPLSWLRHLSSPDSL